MNEMDELARMRASVPAEPSGGRAQTALLEAIRAEQAGTPAPARRPGYHRGTGPLSVRRAVLAGGLSLTVAAGLTAVLVTQSGPAAHGLTVAELSYRSAAAAEATAPVPPGQWIYSAGVDIDGKPSGPFQVWTTADDSSAAWLLRGKVTFIKGPLIGLPIPIGDGVSYMGGGGGKLPVAYDQLGSLPSDPKALEQFLAGLPLPGFRTDAEKAFDAAGELLESYQMPPQIAANILRAVRFIPGVTVNSQFTDTTGRPGIGFLLSQGSATGLAIVMDPQTFGFRTYQVVDQHPGQPIKLTGPVVQQQELVSGPGVVPPSAKHR